MADNYNAGHFKLFAVDDATIELGDLRDGYVKVGLGEYRLDGDQVYSARPGIGDSRGEHVGHINANRIAVTKSGSRLFRIAENRIKE